MTETETTNHWILTSGTDVNNALKKHPRLLSKLSILDASKPKYAAFSQTDWDEIQQFIAYDDLIIPNIPELPLDCLDGLRSSAATWIAKAPIGLGWLGYALMALYIQYNTDAMNTENNERSYDVLWAAFLENSFLESEWRITRGETTSRSIKQLLNGSRSCVSTKVLGGPKFDGLIIPKVKASNAIQMNLEFGFVEVSREEHMDYDRKLIDDLQKISKGMLASFRVCEGPDFRVSVMTSGHQLRVIILKRHPAGVYVSRTRDPVCLPKVYNGEAVAKVVREVAVFQRLLSLWKILNIDGRRV